jgi:hypothetical protein
LGAGAAVHAVEVVDEGFHGLEDFFVVGFFHEGGHVAVEEAEGLAAVHVVLGGLEDDGGKGGGGGGPFRRTDEAVAVVEAVGEEFAERDLDAGEGFTVEVEVVDVDVAALVGGGHVFGDEAVEVVGFAGGAGDLEHFGGGGVGDVGVFAVGFDEDFADGVHEVGFGVADAGALVAVEYVGFGGAGVAFFDEYFFDGVLDVFDAEEAAVVFLFEVFEDIEGELDGHGFVGAANGFGCFEDGFGDFCFVEWVLLVRLVSESLRTFIPSPHLRLAFHRLLFMSASSSCIKFWRSANCRYTEAKRT